MRQSSSSDSFQRGIGRDRECRKRRPDVLDCCKLPDQAGNVRDRSERTRDEELSCAGSYNYRNVASRLVARASGAFARQHSTPLPR